MLTLEVNPADLQASAARFGLSARQIERATVGAINDVATRNRNFTRTQVRGYLTLPTASVNSRVELVKRASQANPEAVVTIDRRGGKQARPTLMSFGGKPQVPRREGKRTKTGKLTKSARSTFSYQIAKTAPRVTLPGGFVQRPTRRFNLQTGAVGAVAGTQGALAFRRKGPGRYPLTVARGPTIAAVYQSDKNTIRETVVKDLEGRLGERVQGRARVIYQRQFKETA